MKKNNLEGMIFGALILAVGIGYLIYKKTGSLQNGIMIGAAIGLVDVIVLRYIAKLMHKNKKD